MQENLTRIDFLKEPRHLGQIGHQIKQEKPANKITNQIGGAGHIVLLDKSASSKLLQVRHQQLLRTLTLFVQREG